MKANLHWIKKLLQVSFVPAEIRPGKSRPEMYMVPPKQKPTSLHVLLVFAPVVWLCHKKKLKNLEKTKKPKEKQYSRTLAKAKIQKSKKPRENQKNQKKQYSRTLAKVKMQKSKKPRENQKNQKKQYSRSLEMGSTDKSSGILFFFVFLVFSRFFWFLHFSFSKSPGILFFLVFFVFFGFLEVFLIFAFFLFQESWNIVFFGFFGFFGFLEVFWVRFFMMKMHYILDDVY